MQKYSRVRSAYAVTKWQKLTVGGLLVGFLAALLGIALKHLTEHYEAVFFERFTKIWWLALILPAIGLGVIFFLRKYIFRGKQNKGMREVFDSIENRSDLPSYKISSHFVNGFLTVGFGGSTGIEVSTVVATAAIGSLARKKDHFLKKYRSELIGAAVAAGVAALFNSPVAGALFAIEVISRKRSKEGFMLIGMAVLAAFGLLLLLDERALFATTIPLWHWYALPYFAVLGVIAGLHSVFLTKSVLYTKTKFSAIGSPFHKILAGSCLIGFGILLFPQLYGDGYHAIRQGLLSANVTTLSLPLVFSLFGLAILKPLLTSVTLGAGGDGGVFAPSIFMGAFLGLLLGIVLNVYFDAGVIPLNFMFIGMAAVLSASINAPFTALFLICGLSGSYTLFLPILLASLVSRYVAQRIFPFTVYTYNPVKPNHAD